MKQLLILLSLSLFLFSCSKEKGYDVCVYGGNAGGVMAAYSAKMQGKTVLLIKPKKHLGGMTTGGLGATDIGNKFAISGLARQFYRKLGKYYGKFESWEFEPSIAEKTMEEYATIAGFDVMRDYRIDSLIKSGTEIESIIIENCSNPEIKKIIKAKVFIDASYEADLMAKAGVSYMLGRESNSEYNETLNGVQIHDKHQFPPIKGQDFYIDPYLVKGDSTSGLCWGISNEPLAIIGSGDKKIQAYNYRLCLSFDSLNRVPFDKPEGYDSSRYELLYRLIAERDKLAWKQPLRSFFLRIIEMPNKKTDVNNHGAFSTDMIGMNYDYPEASYSRRAEIEKEHEFYIRGLLYFLSSDSRIPQPIRDEMNKYGWAKDEFTDNNYFPFQLYVREARRMIGEYVMTENNCRGKAQVTDTVGMGAYNMDSHNAERVIMKDNGDHFVKNAGDVQEQVKPYPIPYGSIIPKESECTNLLVPVCMSATHIAYGSIRMEPVFMMLGQASGLAACMAIDQNISVQQIDRKKLQRWLETDPYLDGTMPDVLIDNLDTLHFSTISYWKENENWMGQYHLNCLYSDSNTGNIRRANFKVPANTKGEFDVYYYCSSKPNPWDMKNTWKWAENAPIRIIAADKSEIKYINFEKNNHEWVSLGSYNFTGSENEMIELLADTVNMPVPADAVLLIAKTRE